MDFDSLLRLVSLMNLMVILSHLIGIQGRERHVGDFAPSEINISLCLNIYRQVSFKLGVIVQINNSTVWYQFECPSPSFKVTVVRESKTPALICSQISQSV